MSKGKSTWKYNKLLTARKNYFDGLSGPSLMQRQDWYTLSTTPTMSTSPTNSVGIVLGGYTSNPTIIQPGTSTISDIISQGNKPTTTTKPTRSFLGLDWSNPFKSSDIKKVAGAIGGAVGNIGGALIGNGYSSGVGSTMRGLSGIASAIPGPWGAAASAALGIGAGVTDRLFGSKMNTENIAKVEANINALNNFKSDASNFDQLAQNWSNAVGGMEFSDSFIGSDGIFSNKAKKKARSLREQVAAGKLWTDNSLNNNAENISDTQMGTLMENYLSLGGNLLSKGGSIFIKPENRGKFTETKKRTGKTIEELTHSKNPLTRKRAIFAQNAKKWHHAFGGELNTQGGDFTNGLLYIDNGGSHESNPNEGVPFGYDQNGIPNLVEEGETVFNDYVFSKRLRIPKSLRKKYKLGGDISYAEASKKLAKESEERPNDPISTRGLEYFMQDLAMSQEISRTKNNSKKSSKESNLFEGGGNTGSGSNKPRLQVIDPEKVRRQARQQARLRVVNTERRLKGDPPLTLTRPDDPSMEQYKTSKYTMSSFPMWTPLMDPNIDLSTTLQPPSGFEYNGYSTGRTNTSAQKTNNNSNSGNYSNTQVVNPIVYTDTYSDGSNKTKTKTAYRQSSVDSSNRSSSSDRGTKSNTKGNTDNSQTSIVPTIKYEHKIRRADGTLEDLPTTDQYYSGVDYNTGNTWADTFKDKYSFDITKNFADTTNSDGSITRRYFYTPVTPKQEKQNDKVFSKGTDGQYTIITGDDPYTTLFNSGNYSLANKVQNPDGSYNYYYDPVEETPPVEPRPTWMRYTPAAALGITSLTDALGLTNKPDYTNADAIAEMYKGTSLYRPVSFSPLGNYLTYRPFDRDYYLNKMSSEAGATRRNLLNTSGGNRAAARAGLLAADNQYLGKVGDLARQAEEFNMQQKQAVADFNRETDSINASGMFQADSANQRAFMEAMSQYLKGMETAAAMREKARLTADAAKSANLSNFITSIGDIGRENMAWNWRDFYKATSAPVATELEALLGETPQTTTQTTSKKDSTTSKAKGGKIKRRKGLTY